MKKVKIIPCLDVKDGRIVKGVNFLNLVDAGDPVAVAQAYSKEGADELVFLDISATIENRTAKVDMVRKIADYVDIPFIVGGGINNLNDIQLLLRQGADKVVISSAAFQNPALIKEAAKKFGRQCIVVGIDAKKREDSSGYDVYISGGKINTKREVSDWARELCKLGAGQILLTSMDRDGTKEGYDIELTKTVKERCPLPLIASGGAGKIEDFKDIIVEGKADAVLAASLFHFKEVGIRELKEYLKKEGINVNI